MRKFIRHEGVAAAIIRDNIDTDAIIPSVEMKRVSKKGLAPGLFAGWRYADRVKRLPNPDFVLNQEPYKGASILLGGKNFGCGSSREHAVWALDEFGIRAVIAPSFGAIFRTNCIANGLLPIILEVDKIGQLVEWVKQNPRKNQLHIDLEQRMVNFSAGQVFHFNIEDSDAEMLLNGWDPIALTLRLEDHIKTFEESDRLDRPWVYL
jgi:3-isopropylmalate/(R)-2-methylmalate dehydratase small subunit